MLNRIISPILIILAMYFIGSMISDYWDEIIRGPEQVNKFYFTAAVVLFQIYWVYQIFLWRWILTSFGVRVRMVSASRLYFTNNLLAYIPGKIANIIGMAGLAGRMEISKASVISTVILFQIYALISGTALIGMLSYFLSDNEIKLYTPFAWFHLFVWLSVAGLISITPRMLKGTLRVVKKLTKRKMLEVTMPFGLIIQHILAYSMGWLLLGLVVYLLLHSFGVSFQVISMPLIIVIFISSYLVGLLAFIVPAGVGILEAGMIFGLSSYVSIEQAFFSVISFRFIGLLLSIVSLAGVLLYLRVSRLERG
jgi:uncharacterized membrane protein YbhN (UPF0104 family)